jgi:hypothetical protein
MPGPHTDSATDTAEHPIGAPGDASATDRPSRPPGPSAKPALIVVGIAALVLLIGGIGAALTSSGSAAPPAAHSLPTAPGAGITAVAGRPDLAPLEMGGQPPGDILNVVALPKGTVVTAGSATNNGIGLYDHSLSFTIPRSEQKVIDFFRAELKALKWQIVSQGPPPNNVPGYRIVGQHPSSDGYEWEIGVTVAPTTFGTGAQAALETTSYAVRLFAVTDD